MANDDLLKELRIFISGNSRGVKCNELELARTALGLLQALPSSRDAVLEYFCSLFDSAVKSYAAKIEGDQLIKGPVHVNQQEDAVIGEIHGVLCNFVSSSPHAWAPIISSWSLKLLGILSSRYSRLPAASGLNETLHWWMSCKAARTLVDITILCLQSLINADTEACVSSLLDTSVAHSPHFDWVVAHVGSCFSKTVVTRVLTLGLKGLCAAGAVAGASAKLKSVVGILGHLGSSHFVDIRSALLELFQWGISDAISEVEHRQAVVPYLVRLASKSQTLLRALSAEVLQTLDMNMLRSLAKISHAWPQYFRQDEQMEDIVVSLALRCERGAAKIVCLLLEAASCDEALIATTSEIILELLLEEIDVQLRSSRTNAVPFLDALRAEIGHIQHLLLCEDPLRQRYICRLYRLIESVNVSVATDAVSYLLSRGTQPTHMSTLLQLIGLNQYDAQGSNHQLLARALEQSLWDAGPDVPAHKLWENLADLLKYEAQCDIGGLSDGIVSKAISTKLLAISEVLLVKREPKLQHAIMNVLDLLPSVSTASLPLRLSLRFVCSTVKYFFLCIMEKDDLLKTVECRRACDLLTKWCISCSAVRPLALRELLESALFGRPAAQFGSCRRSVQRLVDKEYSLSEENYKLGTRQGRQGIPFWNNIITKVDLNDGMDQTTAETNMQHLIDAVRSCCMVNNPMNSGGPTLSLDAMVQVALLLVELISPDVMYNGLPWPEEEFCKVTIERDTRIRRLFDEIPVVWRLLEMLARQQPALCYCSILLRALSASLLTQWSSPSPNNHPTLVETTVRLLQLMCLGQLLPPPLTSLHQIVPVVTPSEVLAMLRGCVWNYLRDHVPSPSLFAIDQRSGFMWRDISTSRPPLIYTEPMRLVMLQNIRHFGALYHSLFVRV